MNLPDILNRLHHGRMHEHGGGYDYFLRSREANATRLREEAMVPSDRSRLVKSVYGPLCAANVPTLLPHKVLNGKLQPIKRPYGTLSLPPKLRFVLEENWEALMKGDELNSPQQLADYARWHMGDESLSDEKAVDSLAKDVKQVGNAPRIAEGFLRLAISLGSPKMAEVAKKRIAKYFLDSFGLRQSEADMDSMKATMLPLIIQDGLPDLARTVVRTGGGANDVIKAIYGLGIDHYVGDWISSERDELYRGLVRLGVNLSGGIAGLVVGLSVGGVMKQNEIIAPLLNLLALGFSPAVLGFAGIPGSRWVMNEDMSRPIQNIEHRYEAFGLLLQQLKWDFETQKNRWVGPMLQDAVDMQRIPVDIAISNMFAGLCSTRMGALLDAEISVGETRFKELHPGLNLQVMDVQPDKEIQEKLINPIVPQDRITPLSVFMDRVVDMMHVIKRTNEKHAIIGYPSRNLFEVVFKALGKDRLQTIKTIAPIDPIGGLALALPSAHRIATLGEQGITKGFKSTADASQFGGYGINPGSAGIELSLALLYAKSRHNTLSGSQEGTALAEMLKAVEQGDSPLTQLRSGFEKIGCGISPLGPLAVWATERNPDWLGTNGLYKDLSDSFKSMLGSGSPPAAGQVDYALRLISTTRHYEQFAENLKNIYPQNRTKFERVQDNLKFFRRVMIDTLWNAFTVNLKQSLINENPIFTYALISMIQEDPGADWPEKFSTMISASGVKGKFFETPGRGIPTTIATLVKYMSEDKELVAGLNKYGFNPTKVTELVNELKKTHITERLIDFIMHVYGFSRSRDKTFPSPSSQPREYSTFVDMIDRAHTYFDKTLSLVTNDQLLKISNELKLELLHIYKTISNLAKGSDHPERQTYAYNIQRIGDLAGMIDRELDDRKMTEERYEEITVNSGDSKPITIYGIVQLASEISRVYSTACNAIPIGLNNVTS